MAKAVTAIGEISETIAGLRAIDRLQRTGRLPLRVYTYLWAPGTMSLDDACAWREILGDVGPMLSINGVKLFWDECETEWQVEKGVECYERFKNGEKGSPVAIYLPNGDPIAKALLARGAVEVAPGHYPLIVALHAGWLGGLWLIARSPTNRPYPCRCRGNCGMRCPCHGRTDTAAMPTVCCARRAAETAARQLAEH